jgi:DNA topoisomerase-2
MFDSSNIVLDTQRINLSEKEHVLLRPGMYAGPKELTTGKFLNVSITDNMLSATGYTSLKYSPALYKIIDETFTNAADALIGIKAENVVKGLLVSYDVKTGQISIMNVGNSIDITRSKCADGIERLRPEVLFGLFRSGTNYSTGDSNTAGVNGYGVKLTNVYSSYFEVTTVDNKTTYKQFWKNNMDIKSEPEINNVESKLKYVKISYIPDYKLEDGTGVVSDRKIASELHERNRKTFFEFKLSEADVEQYIKLRLFETALYLNNNGLGNITYKYNGQNIRYSIESVLSLFGTQLINYESNKTTSPYNIYIRYDRNRDECKTASIINGISVNVGTHFGVIQDQIANYIKPKIKEEFADVLCNKRLSSNIFTKYLGIYIVGTISNLKFSGQTKEVIKNDVKTLSNHTLDVASLETIYNKIKSNIETDFINNLRERNKKEEEDNNLEPVNVAQKKISGRKVGASSDYYPAALLKDSSAIKSNFKLVVAEGDSALSLVIGIRNKGSKDDNNKNINPNYCGAFSIQGVPINVKRLIKKDTNGNITHADQKFTNNKKFTKLLAIIGLDLSYTYKSDIEFEQLNYRKLIIASDQDEDGKGNIRSLLICAIYVLWPALVTRGFISYWETPIIRIKLAEEEYKECYSISEFTRWQRDYKGKKISTDDIEYLKGLGSNDPSHYMQLRNVYIEHVIILTNELEDMENNSDFIDIYFGNDSDLRKKAISTNRSIESVDKISNNTIPLYWHLLSDRDSFSKYVLHRMLPSTLDGLIYAKRLVLANCFKIFGKTNKFRKISDIVATTITNMNYAHGGASLEKVVVGMCQRYNGSHDFPYMVGKGSLGNRITGTKAAAAPRYISARPNNPLLRIIYPEDDDMLLSYEMDSGKYTAPKYYVPIVPMTVLDNIDNIAHGWKATFWGRDINQVLAHIRLCIAEGNYVDCKSDYDVSTYKLKHIVKNNISYGKYIKTGEYTIVITELPLGKYTTTILFGSSDGDEDELEVDEKKEKKGKNNKIAGIETLQSKKPELKKRGIKYLPEVVSFSDETDENNISIKVTFNVPVSKLEEGDIYKYLGLCNKLTPCLNTIGCGKDIDNKLVREFKEYKDITKYWFEHRKQLYIKRYKYKSFELRREAFKLTALIKFVSEARKMGITNVDEDKQISILEEYKYVKINTKMSLTENMDLDEYFNTLIDPKHASYSYLLDLKISQMTSAYQKKCQDKLTKLKEEYAYINKYKKFQGDNMWIAELEAFVEAIKR